MKFILTLVLLLFLQTGYAETWYISPSGNDASGNGSVNNPWKTLYKATSAVTKAGDIIHVTAGTYIEMIRCNLAVGVSIEGEGAASIIQSTLSQQFVAIIIAVSPEGTDGNQHISNIKLDGNKRTTSWAIEVRGRSNFSVYDCIITDFDESGVYFGGRTDNNNEPPLVYATGNSFYNNVMTNCAKYDGYGRGCLVIGGQKGMLIYNNTISQTGRAKGTNGWPIKYCNNGFLKGCKIYDNKITKQAYDGMTWDFAIELFNESGLEVYGNTIVGSVDMNYQTKGEYPYSIYIHDNIIGPATVQPKVEAGIIMEFSTETAIIENNRLQNLALPVYFTPRDGSVVSDIIIKKNTCENIGVADGSHRGFAINFSPDGGENFILNNFFVDSNTFIGSIKEGPYYGVGILSAAAATNIKIQNNTIKNFSVAGFVANPASVIDGLLIEKNILSNNGNNNEPVFTRGYPANYTVKNNQASGPSQGFNLKQRVLRPLYYELKSMNLLQLIAMFAGILGLWFCRIENIYFFPLALVNAAVSIFSNFDTDHPATCFVFLCYFPMYIYGWIMWSKRDRKQHRIIRITSSTKKDWLIQLVFFAAFFIAGFFVFTYYKNLFAPGIIPWADAFATAAVFTGMWLITKKKVESWYWWMAASIVFILLNYINYHLVQSGYYFMMLLMSAWCLYEWKRRRISREYNR